MDRLKIPRYKTAKSEPPGSRIFWEVMLDQSDVFAYNTANAGKGGPFGAQLWLVNLALDHYIIVGGEENREDSNAVISKGMASAHAEAENLCLEKRQQVIEFLESHRNENWKVVQVSSGESCPCCRSKQILFSHELIELNLIKNGDFHVIFKGNYIQAKNIAGFSDAPYDQAFRAISSLGILDKEVGLVSLEKEIFNNPVTSAQVTSGELIYIPVNQKLSHNIAESIKNIFLEKDEPLAIVLDLNGNIISLSYDERDVDNYSTSGPEKTAIIAALHKAAIEFRNTKGKYDAWNLRRSVVYTNIADIGPISYSECLWYNISEIIIISDMTNSIVERLAQEMSNTRNRTFFKQVAADYDSDILSLKVSYLGGLEEGNVAYSLWKAKMAMEKIKNKQASRIKDLAKHHVESLEGNGIELSSLVENSNYNSHYDGKTKNGNPP